MCYEIEADAQVAFFLKGSDRMYLGLAEEDVVELPGRVCQTDSTQDIVGDNCTWTICSCGIA